jgi:hypothetical protein
LKYNFKKKKKDNNVFKFYLFGYFIQDHDLISVCSISPVLVYIKKRERELDLNLN